MKLNFLCFQHFMILYATDPVILGNLSTVNCILVVLLRYFHLTNFFWMFVEGEKIYKRNTLVRCVKVGHINKTYSINCDILLGVSLKTKAPLRVQILVNFFTK